MLSIPALSYGTTYYWKVDEVGATSTYPGSVWSFTTQEFAVVDDFESYNDGNNRIYDTWIDGLTDGKSGSTVGYMANDAGTFILSTACSICSRRVSNSFCLPLSILAIISCSRASN